MSEGMREIKRRIKSVGSTRQITKAMNLVASSKLNRSRDRYTQIMPFYEMTGKVISSMVGSLDTTGIKYLTERDVSHITIIVLAGDRGLCGGYNIAVCQTAIEVAADVECDFITVGSKAFDYLNNRGKNISHSFKGISEKPTYEDARKIGEIVVRNYTSGKTDAVYLAYTKYNSTISYESTCVKLFPFDINGVADMGEETDKAATLYEPSAEAVFSYVLPKYINTIIYGAMAEASLCEQSARMTAMDSATENADDMLDSLNTRYNRARQGAITQEITEIIAGSDL